MMEQVNRHLMRARTFHARCLFCVAISIVSPVFGFPGDRNWSSGFRGKEYALVKAVVSEQRNANQFLTSIHHIEHVYSGNPKLAGQNFEYHIRKRPLSGSQAASLHSPPKVGEQSIWMVRWNESAPIQSFVFPLLGIGFPSQRSINEDYPQVVKLAEQIERYQTIEAGQQLKFLEEQAHSEVPQIAYWAVTVIGDAQPPEFERVMEDFKADAKLPFAAQVALDEYFAVELPKNWVGSERRFEMLRDWLYARVSPYEYRHIRLRIDQILKRPDIYGALTDAQGQAIRECLGQ
jgi:hypothetical protein